MQLGADGKDTAAPRPRAGLSHRIADHSMPPRLITKLQHSHKPPVQGQRIKTKGCSSMQNSHHRSGFRVVKGVQYFEPRCRRQRGSAARVARAPHRTSQTRTKQGKMCRGADFVRVVWEKQRI